MMTSNYSFLTNLHDLLQPSGYLEVGVRAGGSLDLARCSAIGIDPRPERSQFKEGQWVFQMNSDEYFSCNDPATLLTSLDFAYIDGMHLFEFALRDFINIERHSHPRTVAALDDVLPYEQSVASRFPRRGDWTGDVWKLLPILAEYRSGLDLTLVDTMPCGTLIVTGLDKTDTVLRDHYGEIVAKWSARERVPSDITGRTMAIAADKSLILLERWMGSF